MLRKSLGLMLIFVASIAAVNANGDDQVPDGTVTVLTTDGKESKVTGVKFTTGTHRLAWLADPNGTTEDAKKGPLAFEVREIQSTTFTKGVVTYVPLAHLESAKYDSETKIATFGVKGLKEPLKGTLQF